MSKLFRIVVDVVCEMLTIKDPFYKWRAPEITGRHQDKKGRGVLEVRADNYIDAASLRDGITFEGNVYKSAVHLGGDRWELRIEDFDLEGLGDE